MADPRHEIRDAVEQTLANMKPIADRHPETPMSKDVFNLLLDRAREAFPDLEVIKGLKPVNEGTNVSVF